MDIFSTLLQSPTNWIILGLVLAGIEMLLPGVFFIWLGVGAIIVGMINFFIPLSIITSLILFAVISLLCIVCVIFIYRKKVPDSKSSVTSNLNSKLGNNLIGQIITVSEDITETQTQMRIGDSTWWIEGDPCLKGEKIRLISFENNVFKYELIK